MGFKIRAGKSPIDGDGVFCTRPIRKNELVCRMEGEVISVRELKKRYNSGREKSTNPLQVGDSKYIDLDKPFVYINHSCRPNAAIVHFNDLRALRNIKVGEEITYDYSAVDWPNQKYWRDYSEFWSMKCNCGAVQCRKVIRSWLFMPRIWQRKYIKNRLAPDFIIKKYMAKKEQLKEQDKRRYVLSDARDLEILNKIYQLEISHLSQRDRKIVKLIRTQLKKDWRQPLLRTLNSLVRRYS